MKRVEEEQTSTCEEKTNAALALAAVARVTREHFSEHVDDAVGVLHSLAVAYQPSIRRAAFVALAPCVSASVAIWSAPIRSSPASMALHATTESHADAAIFTCLLALEDDDDAETVARTCECLGSITCDVGWAFLRRYLKRLTKRLRKLIMERALCNRKSDALSWQTSQDLYTSVSHMLCALSRSWAKYAATEALAVAKNPTGRVLQETVEQLLVQEPSKTVQKDDDAHALWEIMKSALAEWQNFLDEVFPAILDWAGPLQPEWLRRLAFGVVGAIVQDAPLSLHPKAIGSFDRYSFPLFPLLNASLAQALDGVANAKQKSRLQEEVDLEEDRLTVQARQMIRTSKHQMLQNAAYCVGILATQGDKEVALEAFKLRPRLLALLQPQCRADAAARDNAVLACFCAAPILLWWPRFYPPSSSRC